MACTDRCREEHEECLQINQGDPWRDLFCKGVYDSCIDLRCGKREA